MRKFCEKSSCKIKANRKKYSLLNKIKMLGIGCVMLLCSLNMSACHGSKGMGAFEIPQEFDTQKQYEITFWAKNDTNKTQTMIYEKAIKDFEDLYPNIKVNLRLYTDYGRIYNDVITNISTNTTPNVCITYPDHIATYLTGANQVVPLDTLLSDVRFGLGGSEIRFDAPMKEEIVPQFLEECQIGEHIYAVPYMRSTEACYINKTYVEKLGFQVPDILTWDFIWEVSEAAMLKEADGTYQVNSQNVLIPFIYKSTDNMMIQMLKQKNAPYSTSEGEIELFSDTTNTLLYEIAEHGKSGAFSTFKISSYPANFLNAGQCIFAIDSTAGATWMGSKAPLSDIAEDKIVDFETVVRMIPQFDPDHPKMISQGPSICIFNKEDPGEVLASWFFVQYMLSNEVQNAYASTEGYVPVTLKAQQSKEYQEYLLLAGTDEKEHYEIKMEATKLLLEHTDDTFTTPVFVGSASLRDAAGQMIENTVKAVRRNQTVDESFMERLKKDMNSLYRLDQITQGASVSGEKKELGPLPNTAVFLLVSLAVVWIGILFYVVFSFLKNKRKKK